MSALELQNILSKANAPNCLLRKIILWAQAASDSGGLPKLTNPFSYRSLITATRSSLYGDKLQKHFLPIMTVLKLPSNRMTTVSHFDIRISIFELLSDKYLMNWGNTIFTGKAPDPFQSDIFSEIQDLYGEINSGTWYKETVEMYQDEKNLVIPLILFIDATNIDAYGKYPWRVLVSLWGSSKGE